MRTLKAAAVWLGWEAWKWVTFLLGNFYDECFSAGRERKKQKGSPTAGCVYDCL
jgi:hypothetical protein